MYEAHHGWLQSWLNKRLSSRDTAADLAQDTFVSVLKHPTDTISAIHEPRAYLTTIAKRILCNYYQRQSLESAYLQALGDLGTAHALSAEDQVILLQTLHDIDQMLGSLPHKTRLAFLLLHLEHMKYAEIASELQVSERTVKRYIASAYEHCLHFML
ncbi:sigma-70 family RNA polymerase sigma factor [Methylobacillus glycogenes]|uniref:sigma-70 family RNA polymerase sigma factor n=1 Tax=Methylobacillus glycogenes TaxID=406 RepID=UPI000686BCB2|nr:sigma-70 family RNA polymerase sigma factor [Methylobacillus glycogenes]